MASMVLLLLSLSALLLFVGSSPSLVSGDGSIKPSFTIADNQFIRDGDPIILRSGCLHYPRVRPEYWQDRLLRMKAMGMNGVQAYVPWNYHNPAPGVYNFDGDRDLESYFTVIQSLDMLLVLRLGPYICGEWDFGGFPGWIISQNVTLRTYEDNYIRLVDEWWDVLLPMIKPYLYENGGPIVAVQVENEYGSYGDVSNNPLDKKYLLHLIDRARFHLGSNVILFTTDGGSEEDMTRGSLKGSAVLTVGDFGPGTDVKSSFAAADEFNPEGMKVRWCSEYYPGWLTHWGEPSMANTSAIDAAVTLDQILSMNGSVSIYMAHGGSNFESFAGANGNGGTGGTSAYASHTQTYDYSAPISEGGEHGIAYDGDKYLALQKVFYTHFPDWKFDEPTLLPRTAYGQIPVLSQATLFDRTTLSTLTTMVYLNEPELLSMEMYNQSVGFIMYEAKLSSNATISQDGVLSIPGVRDFAYVFINSTYIGYVRRDVSSTDLSIPFKYLQLGGFLRILVEDMGRINYGHGMMDPKGLVQPVLLNSKTVSSTWTVYMLPLETKQLSQLSFSAVAKPSNFFTFYKARLDIESNVVDTWFSSRGWGKGYLWVNGFLLGRYWDAAGPQHSIYIPSPLLKQGSNDILLLELETPNPALNINFIGQPDLTQSSAKTAGWDWKH